MQILLYGGGIDSTALLHYLTTKDKVTCLFVRYGQKAEELEYKSCQYFCSKYGAELITVRSDFREISDCAIMQQNHKSTSDIVNNVLDGRNLCFITMAGMLTSKLQCDTVNVGFHIEPDGSPFIDAKEEFIQAVNKCIRSSFNHKFEVVAPFQNIKFTREDIFRYALQNDKEILQAHTCYENVEGGCGQCAHCKLKEQLLKEIKCVE